MGTDIPEFCSQCGGGPYTNVFSHWSHPNVECRHPTPEPIQQDVLLGLWLAGAAVLMQNRGKYPSLQKDSSNRALLEWVHETLGMWSAGDISERTSASEAQESIRLAWGEESNAGASYTLHTRAFPYLERFTTQSYEEVDLTPGAARVFYAFRGRTGEGAVRFIHREGTALADLLGRAGFETAVYNPPRGKSGYRLRIKHEASQQFSAWVNADNPLPGCEEKFAALSDLR